MIQGTSRITSDKADTIRTQYSATIRFTAYFRIQHTQQQRSAHPPAGIDRTSSRMRLTASGLWSGFSIRISTRTNLQHCHKLLQDPLSKGLTAGAWYGEGRSGLVQSIIQLGEVSGRL